MTTQFGLTFPVFTHFNIRLRVPEVVGRPASQI